MSLFMYLNNDANGGNFGKPIALTPFCDSQKNGSRVDDDTRILLDTLLLSICEKLIVDATQ